MHRPARRSVPWRGAAGALALALALVALAGCWRSGEDGSDRLPSRPLFRVRLDLPGLDYVNLSGDPEQLSVLEQNGQGIALLDYDGDGRVDLFVTNGGTFDRWRRGELPGARLYRNLGGWRFADVTVESGLAAPVWGTGAAAADLDGDGWPDLYLAAWGGDRFFRNQGDGTFVDATERAGLGSGGWSSSVAVADFDGDGRLDLYVSRYVAFDPERIPDREADGSPCAYRGIVTGCGPWRYPGERDLLYLQLADGSFRDASESWGLDATAGFRGMGVAPGDFDDDGDVDLYVACDVMPNLHLQNAGGRFVDVGALRGGAVNDAGRHESGMGVAAADLFGHGRLDLVTTNFAGETNTYYANRDGDLVDRSAAAGLAAHPLELGWG
jgi:enediyne biosynthesis protein E4